MNLVSCEIQEISYSNFTSVPEILLFHNFSKHFSAFHNCPLDGAGKLCIHTDFEGDSVLHFYISTAHSMFLLSFLF